MSRVPHAEVSHIPHFLYFLFLEHVFPLIRFVRTCAIFYISSYHIFISIHLGSFLEFLIHLINFPLQL